ncbi:MAG: hypothetical protein ACTSWX_10415 [Promethearchaeota archaeon]
MSGVKSDIEKILLHFQHNNRQYILFSLKSDMNTYLYLKHQRETLISLFYGRDIVSKVKSLLNENTTNCIECELGTLIKGGVSYDEPDLVEFNLTKSEANEILDKIKLEKEVIENKIKIVDFK